MRSINAWMPRLSSINLHTSPRSPWLQDPHSFNHPRYGDLSQTCSWNAQADWWWCSIAGCICFVYRIAILSTTMDITSDEKHDVSDNDSSFGHIGRRKPSLTCSKVYLLVFGNEINLVFHAAPHSSRSPQPAHVMRDPSLCLQYFLQPYSPLDSSSSILTTVDFQDP